MNRILLSLSAALGFGLTAAGINAPACATPPAADTTTKTVTAADTAAWANDSTVVATASAADTTVSADVPPVETQTEAQTDKTGEKTQRVKEEIRDMAEDVKEDLKEGWQDAKESFKEEGSSFWNNLKEKAQEWKEEATDFFETHVKSQVVGQFSDNRRQCNQDFCQHLLGGFKAYKIQTFSPDFPEMPKKRSEPDTAWPALTYVEPAGFRSLNCPAGPAAPEPFHDELIQSNQIKVKADGVELTLDLEPRLNTYGIGAPTEKNLAAFWQKLSESRFDIPLRQIYEAARKHHLNDWGVYRLTQAAAAAIYPKNKNGEQTVWTVFMLNQAGYAAKIGRMGADKKTYRLLVLLPFYEKIYGCPYVEIGGAPFYIMEKLAGKQRSEPVYSYDGCFALGTSPLSLQFRECPGIPCLYEKNDRFAYNLRMLDFYKPYPCAPTALYLHAPCGEVLSKSIQHKCAPLVDSLLHLYETAPACDTDSTATGATATTATATTTETATTVETTTAAGHDAQTCQEAAIAYLGHFAASYFDDNAKKKLKPEGHPLFPEEAFALKAGDGKDRALMHARLVRRFVGLPVILAEYEKTALVGIALPQPPAAAAGQALAAVKGDDGTTFYLFNPNAKDGNFWHCPKPLREIQPVIVL